MVNGLEKLEELMVNNIYKETHILNRREYNKCKKKLLSIDYLPVLLRQVCGTEYYETLQGNLKQREIQNKIHETNNYNLEMIIGEFLEWCEKNNYTNLINKQEEKQLNNSLKEIKEELKYFKTKV